MNKKEIITLLEKAIKESGKSFAVVDFIRRAFGTNQKLINEIFLEMLTKATKSAPKGVPEPKGVPGSKGVSSPKGVGASASSTPSTAKVVNEPKKNPRKSLFSEIKKIT